MELVVASLPDGLCPAPAAVAGGAFDVRARAVSLADVEQVWTASAGTPDRIVFVP